MEELARVAAVLAAVVMFSLGLDLTTSDFSLVFRRPRALLLGLFNQLVVLPGVTLLMCLSARLEPPLVMGFMVLAACPGSAPSNLMTQLARGNRALSVSLTGITSAVSFLTIPAAIATASAVSRPQAVSVLPIVGHAGQILVLCGVPLAVGMLVRRSRPHAARALGRLFPPFCVIAVIGIVGATLWLQRREVAAAMVSVGALALLLNLLTLGISFAIAWLAGIDGASRVALGLECSMHNNALGVYVCVTMLAGMGSVMPTLAYTMVMWVTAPMVVVAIRRLRSVGTTSEREDARASAAPALEPSPVLASPSEAN